MQRHIRSGVGWGDLLTRPVERPTHYRLTGASRYTAHSDTHSSGVNSDQGRLTRPVARPTRYRLTGASRYTAHSDTHSSETGDLAADRPAWWHWAYLGL